MVAVDLLEFIRTGALGPVHLGMTDAQVRQILGEPDMESNLATDPGIPYICKYGDMELYYEQDDGELVTIHTDPKQAPCGGGGE